MNHGFLTSTFDDLDKREPQAEADAAWLSWCRAVERIADILDDEHAHAAYLQGTSALAYGRSIKGRRHV